jgi:uncharacterized membrane protein
MNAIEQKIAIFTVGGSYLLILLLGLFFYFYPPKKINGIYGYRTPRSMKNLENWHFANKLSAKYMLLNSFLAFLIFMVSFWTLKNSISVDALILINMGVLCLSLIAMIPMVETKLKKFEEKQKRPL